MPKRSRKVSPKEAEDAAKSLAKVNILPNNWPEYLRKLGFSDRKVERYVNKKGSLTPYWIKLKGMHSELSVGVEKLVQYEVNRQKRNKQIDEILVHNQVNKNIIRNRNRAWFLYDFICHYADNNFMKHDIGRMKFELTDSQLSQIECDYKGNSLEQRYQILSTWVRAKNLTKLKKIANKLNKLDLISPEIYNLKSKMGSSSQDADTSSESSDSYISSESNDEEISSEQEMKISGLKHALQNSITPKNGQQATLPLQVTKQENVKLEKFGNASSWSFRKLTDKSNITAENLFDEAARTCAEKAKSSHEAIIKPRHNVAGVTGIAGVGKTTFCKSVAKKWMKTHPESFVFYISSRDLDFEMKKYNVLKFLLESTDDYDHEHSPESDKLILEKIKQSSDTLIVIDGLDEAKHKGNFSEYPSTVKLYNENESAYNILMNLLNGRLLPNAKKLIASRPFAFQHFHPECRPLFMAHVLGLSPESQILLCKEVCETEEQQVILLKELEKQPNISALCFIPMFGKMIVKNFFENLKSGKSIRSICEIFMNQFEHWQMNPQFKTDVQLIPKLAKLAFDGIQNRQFQFTHKKLMEYDLDGKSIESFMSVHTKSSKDPNLMILDGKEVFFFIHATWQEFLAALHLMVFASNEEFSAKVVKMFKEGHWEIVTRFLFGFCHQQTQAKLQAIFTDSHDVRDKEKLFKSKFLSFLPDMLEKLPGNFPVSPAKYYSDVKSLIIADEFNSHENDSTLFNICSWAYEAQDDDLTKAVSNSLPSPLLLSGDVLPHEIVCFCHVLLAAEGPHILNVGTWLKPATFLGEGLQTLLNTVQQSKHKITKLHLTDMDLLEYFDDIFELCPDISELTLQYCGLSYTFIKEMVDFIGQHKIHLSFLNLSWNDLNGIGQLLDTCADTIPMLWLCNCNLKDDDFTSLSRALRKRNTNMVWLNLSGNELSQNALECLAPSVHRLDVLELKNCSVSGDSLKQLCHEILKRQKPMDLLNLSGNVLSQNALESLAPSVHQLDGLRLHGCSVSDDGLKQICHEILNRQKPMNMFFLEDNNIGLIGVSEMSTCVQNIRQLWLENCNLTGTCLKPLLSAILNLKQQMKTFSIGNNKVGSEIVPMLAKCVHKTKRLDLDNCGMNTDDVKVVTNEAKSRDEPMTSLTLNENKFGDEGAIALTECLNKVEVLWLKNCDITSVGAEALWKANLKWNREIFGLDFEFEEVSETSSSSDEMAPVVTRPKKKRQRIS